MTGQSITDGKGIFSQGEETEFAVMLDHIEQAIDVDAYLFCHNVDRIDWQVAASFLDFVENGNGLSYALVESRNDFGYFLF